MRKDTSALESEFIQGGSHDDANTNAHANINSVENIAVGDSSRVLDSSTATKQRSLDHTIEVQRTLNNNNKADQRDDEKSLLGNDQQINDDEASLPNLSASDSSSSSTQSDTTEEPSSTTAVTAEAATSTKPKNVTKSVRFSHCSIRSYNQILGDHPLCAVGCPIALGWKVMREEALTVEDYETIREPLRKKKGAKSPLQHGRKQRRSHTNGNSNRHQHAPIMSMEPTFKYLNSQLKLSAQERRDRLHDYSDTQIRKEWSRMQKQERRGLIKEGMRQFRMVGMHYAGY
mmetsp:Transcript_10746/g.25988  ORF Transcript_10746/g.25988 Transcript_10746/m.25988 type:complete len:288 (+) Transcript_10746:334-1197(+)|eukprot:CAMPEP_0113644904 /NCGR_PEP_ID=MMETSP0017_2-20120614/23643_1 /TAXON_ID=2856 /ORGANISM="Cylindrotheca closterium" /LENGTH=287 /DNA_ID=CAMNT_0000556559 /DNA_START=271 /DNA_END=1134 /DNA_ORIENTATION=+ /assembly_acc=CAM_ASM_000147